ncbi:hypothetical protein FKX85_12745 [Echinicola soli]|uniref:Uncharacterized protein n=1 Tax=Echinicola soli TaxID=2591634 RepID=A0A514CJ49_9BACT|nr:hypothetical protein [Echinicola soli]QDH79851.1 hypothetical protein FKX85_12745 [Echinicola soli]
MIPTTFINYAADTLAETQDGLTGSRIAEYSAAYAIDFDIEIPYPEYPFPADLPNKRTALRENLKAFSSEQQFKIIKELSELPHFENNAGVKDLRIKLISRYGALGEGNAKEEINESLVEETQHWLSEYPEVLKLYNDCLEKHSNGIHQRNLLDDLRLSLETLLKTILENGKSLENQIAELGKFINERNGSKELNNMFLKLIDYFSKYQNTYVKHNDNVNENEVEIIIEMASSFMKFIVRIK